MHDQVPSAMQVPSSSPSADHSSADMYYTNVLFGHPLFAPSALVRRNAESNSQTQQLVVPSDALRAFNEDFIELDVHSDSAHTSSDGDLNDHNLVDSPPASSPSAFQNNSAMENPLDGMYQAPSFSSIEESLPREPEKNGSNSSLPTCSVFQSSYLTATVDNSSGYDVFLMREHDIAPGNSMTSTVVNLLRGCNLLDSHTLEDLCNYLPILRRKYPPLTSNLLTIPASQPPANTCTVNARRDQVQQTSSSLLSRPPCPASETVAPLTPVAPCGGRLVDYLLTCSRLGSTALADFLPLEDDIFSTGHTHLLPLDWRRGRSDGLVCLAGVSRSVGLRVVGRFVTDWQSCASPGLRTHTDSLGRWLAEWIRAGAVVFFAQLDSPQRDPHSSSMRCQGTSNSSGGCCELAWRHRLIYGVTGYFMGIQDAFYKPRTTCLNLGLSCLIAGEDFVQVSSSSESPRIPCTISCVSRLIDLRRLRHPNIVRYLDAQCDKHRRIYLVTEHYASDFSQLNPPVTKRSDFNWLLRRFHECLCALTYLESHGIIHGCLSPSAILIDNFGRVKIAGYGVLYASRWGLDLDFPVVDLRYSSPETLLFSGSCLQLASLESATPPCLLDTRSDLWSLALIFVELLHFPLQTFSTETLLKTLFTALDSNYSFFAHIATSNQGSLTQLSKWMNTLDDICKLCLVLDARHRSPLTEIISKFSEGFNNFCIIDFDSTIMTRDDPAESYYYWQLAGGGVDLASTFLKGVSGSDCLRPPILHLPLYLTGLSPSERASWGGPFELWSSSSQPARLKFCPIVVPLPAERLLKRLALMPTKSLYPLLFPHSYSCLGGDEEGKLNIIDSLALTGVEDCWQEQQNRGTSLLSHLPKHKLRVTDSYDAMIFQPVLVKQADVEYQVMRVCLFRRLLTGMPSTATRLLLEARFDIPPFLRTEVWAALLGVESGYQDDTSRRKVEAALSVAIAAGSFHSRISTQGIGLSDQVMGQISVDLPRCHAYDLLIGSPLGQERLRSVLVATLLANDDRFEYTQNCLSTWPAHVDVVAPGITVKGDVSSTSTGGGRLSSPSTSFKRNEVDYRSITSSLVPLIDPSDALQQLSRSDCVLVDMRSKEEYSSGCLMHSIHYYPIEVEAGVTCLTGSQLWLAATAARNAASPRGFASAHSPGLVMLLQYGSTLGDAKDECETGNDDDAALTLACCLIQRSIDRVCVVKGGLGSLVSGSARPDPVPGPSSVRTTTPVRQGSKSTPAPVLSSEQERKQPHPSPWASIARAVTVTEQGSASATSLVSAFGQAEEKPTCSLRPPQSQESIQPTEVNLPDAVPIGAEFYSVVYQNVASYPLVVDVLLDDLSEDILEQFSLIKLEPGSSAVSHFPLCFVSNGLDFSDASVPFCC
ncbi:TBC domain-containing protein kinase-like protein [Echinococcus granulosus]|uniref:non-specific serine/threonine protein kinase n=1 Tax=Echinococcus granulosus TaxID=6210 RepID=W6V795_ECHGR|nr:TBC domain-containing protein kinase-like protein [Echinococcus granulosus]EUB62324.1 TBC domain-containing protein kinase-like protein [Echinococcus granulosus]